MHRFYCPTLTDVPPADINSSPGSPILSVPLDPNETRHARQVLRLRDADPVELFDGRGTIARGQLQWTDSTASVLLTELHTIAPPSPRLDVAAAIPKGPLADTMVAQLSQLGADRLIPLRTQRSVVDPREGKLQRFARAVIESAKQCGRAHLMQIDKPHTLDQLLTEPHDLRLIALPNSTPLENLSALLRDARTMLILIGPEGGWTEDELLQTRHAHCSPWPLGAHTMRIETAAAAAVSIARYLCNGSSK